MKIDLHIHTKTGSDGNLSVDEVFKEAKKRRLGLVVISSDVTRKQLALIPLTEHSFEEFDTGIYSPGFSRLTYDTMFTEAKHSLGEGGSVILNASFLKAEERQKAKKLVEENNADSFILECTLDERIIKQRLEKRLDSVSDGRWEIFEPQKKRFEPVVEAPEANHVIIDTSVPVEEVIKQVSRKINEE